MKLARILLIISCTGTLGYASNPVLTSLDNAIATTDALVVSLAATSPMDGVIKTELTNVVAPLPGICTMIVAELSLNVPSSTRAGQINQWVTPTLARLSNLSPSAKLVALSTIRDWQIFLNSYPPTL